VRELVIEASDGDGKLQHLVEGALVRVKAYDLVLVEVPRGTGSEELAQPHGAVCTAATRLCSHKANDMATSLQPYRMPGEIHLW